MIRSWVQVSKRRRRIAEMWEMYCSQELAGAMPYTDAVRSQMSPEADVERAWHLVQSPCRATMPMLRESDRRATNGASDWGSTRSAGRRTVHGAGASPCIASHRTGRSPLALRGLVVQGQPAERDDPQSHAPFVARQSLSCNIGIIARPGDCKRHGARTTSASVDICDRTTSV